MHTPGVCAHVYPYIPLTEPYRLVTVVQMEDLFMYTSETSVFAYMYTHIYIYIHLYICICVCFWHEKEKQQLPNVDPT